MPTTVPAAGAGRGGAARRLRGGDYPRSALVQQLLHGRRPRDRVVARRLRDEVELAAARGGVGGEELGHVLRGPVGAVTLEALERKVVEGLHRRRQAGSGGFPGVTE